MDDFIKEFIKIQNDEIRQNQFCSNAIQQDKRIFKILDANVKTYNTIYKYLYDVVNYPNKDNHVAIPKLKYLHLYSDDPNDTISKLRSSIALKVYDNFEEGSFIRDLMIFVFAIESGVGLEASAEFVIDALPETIMSQYYDLLKKAYENATLLNPVYGLYVFYSDREFLYKYLNCFINNPDESQLERIKVIDEDRNNFINARRIHDCQKGSFLNEALIGALYFKLCEISLNNVSGYSNIINKIINVYKDLVSQIKIPNNPQKSDWDKLENLLNSLPNEEKKEILRCFGNVSNEIELYEQDNTKKNIKRAIQYGQGFNIERTVKQRVGQERFRKNLIKQFDTYKCRIKDCKIDKVEFLKASHILEWQRSNEEEKVDPNNGLLLCPSHDFLFDAHLISFNKNGKIMISKTIPKEIYEDFNISENDSIDILPENEKYLEIHRKRFEENESNL